MIANTISKDGTERDRIGYSNSWLRNPIREFWLKRELQGALGDYNKINDHSRKQWENFKTMRACLTQVA